MREIIILITIVTALIAGTVAVDQTTVAKDGDGEDIEKPHIKIPGS